MTSSLVQYVYDVGNVYTLLYLISIVRGCLLCTHIHHDVGCRIEGYSPGGLIITFSLRGTRLLASLMGRYDQKVRNSN